MIVKSRVGVAAGAAAVLVGAYVVISLALIGLGLLMTQVLAHGGVGHWDDDVNTWAVAHRTPTWNTLSADATDLANTPGIVVAAVVVTGLVLLVRRTRWALLLVLGLAVELAGFLTVNYTVGRPRPHVAHLGSTPSTFSWPSGHVAATWVLYAGIAVLVGKLTRRRDLVVLAWTLAAGLTLAVAASRVYRGEHHVTDVVAGLVLGACALLAAVRALERRGERGVSTPVHAP